MLQRTTALLLLASLFLACASSQKYLERGQYEKAIDRSVKKLRKDPGNSDELYVLKEAYTKANGFDMDRINFLEREGRDENFLEIYQLYQRLDYRQNKIKTLPSRVMNEFDIINYDDQLIASKEGAAEVSYARGEEFLARGDRESARMAFYEFDRARSIYPNYKEVDAKIREARYLGMNQVLFVIENNSESVLPERFDEELRKIGLSDLNDQWIQYSVYEDENVNYDYFVVLNIRDIAVSPERIDRETYTDSKEVQDGMKYVLDQNGNVKKDSLGNDIREPNMITVKAEITQARQWKEAIVGGTIDYMDLRTDQLVKTENLSVTALFEHFSAKYTGDQRALSAESRQKIGSEMVNFPQNEAMLMDAALLLKERTKDIMFANRGLLSSTEN